MSADVMWALYEANVLEMPQVIEVVIPDLPVLVPISTPSQCNVH